MCLAIYKPKGKTVPVEHLEQGYYSNPDGAGFAVANRNKLSIHKGYFNFEEFLQAYSEHAHLAAVIHFRYATHGAKNHYNCHPWDINGGEYALVHNGILNIASTDEKSDTGHYADSVIAPLLQRMSPHDSVVKYLVETSIGHGNKIALLKRDGKAVIFNAGKGVNEGGIWYSNDGFRPFQFDRFQAMETFKKNAWNDRFFPEPCDVCSEPLDHDALECATCGTRRSFSY